MKSPAEPREEFFERLFATLVAAPGHDHVPIARAATRIGAERQRNEAGFAVASLTSSELPVEQHEDPT